MKLYIKNMVCERCKTIVKGDLDTLNIKYSSINLGEVETLIEISGSDRKALYNALQKSGFELIDPQKNEIIEKLKSAISDLERFSDEELKTGYADYLSLCVKANFISLNTLFSEIEGITIEKYIIQHKIERVKEMLVYEDLDLSEIARKLHYSSINELDIQFKSQTGLTPAHFNELRNARYIRNSIPDVIPVVSDDRTDN